MGVLNRLLRDVPGELVEALEVEFRELESRFSRADWGPAELNGGRFAEAVLRFLEWKRAGTYTEIGRQLDRLRVVRETENDAALPEGMRFLVSKGAELLLDLRNRRNVAHLGPIKGIDGMDAALVLRVASWMLAEIVREQGAVAPEEAHAIIARLSERRIPLVEEVGGDLVVMGNDLGAATRAMLALYHSYPAPLEMRRLQQAVGYGNSTRFRGLLTSKQRAGLIHMKNGDAYLTRKGIAWLEKYVDMELRV